VNWFTPYWIAYYLVYVVCVGYGIWRFWGLLQKDDWLYPLAAIFGVSLGAALLVAIMVEVTGKMVLLIPAAVKKIRNEGVEEGIEIGREEGREIGREETLGDQRKRRAEAYRRFGVEVDGVRMLPDTPEVEEFLSGTSEKS
jgi:uncharacterized protein (DUF58 family)